MTGLIKGIIIYFVYIFLLANIAIFLTIKFYPEKALGNATEYEMWQFQKKAIDNYDNQTKNVIIGDSRSMACLNPKILGHNFVNLSLGGTSSFEGFCTLKKFLEKSKIDTLIVCYGAYHFSGGEVFNERTLPFQFTSMDNVRNLERVEEKYGVTVEGRRPGTLRNVYRTLLYYHAPSVFRSSFIENITQNNFNSHIINSMKENSGHCLFGRADSSAEASEEIALIGLTIKEKILKINPVIISYLDSMYVLSMKHNIKLIFVNPPINYSSYEKLKSIHFEDQYDDLLDDLKRRFPRMQVYNNYFSLPDSYFGDANHLNLKGSDFFSVYVRSKLANSKH